MRARRRGAALAGIALAGIALALATAAPAAAADRFDRIAGALERDPFYVDPEASEALPQAERADAEKAMGSTGVPVYTVVVPLTTDDESEGEGDAFLHTLHDRMGRDGVYVAVDQDAGIEAIAFGVPRDVDLPTAVQLPPPSETGTRTAGERLLRTAELIRTAPSAAPQNPAPLNTPRPLGEEDPSAWPPVSDMLGVVALSLLLVGPLVGGLLYGAYRLVARMLGYGPPAPAEKADAPARPSERWLRRTAAEELEALGERLAAHDAEARPQVHERAASAYDAGLLLIDEREDPMDLLGAVLLARHGAALLRDGGAQVRPYCYLNPLHGRTAGSQRRRKSLDLPEDMPAHRGAGKVPVCARCVNLPKQRTRNAVLIVGDRPYYAHPGFWNETGLPNTNLPARVLEYLGVE